MDTAKRFAELSHARKMHVGAIVVKDDTIISIGYNGMPSGWDNNCEDEAYDGDNLTLKTKPEVMHAERNALDKLARNAGSGDGAVMFVTHSPCLECAKSILGAGIKQVYFNKVHQDTRGISFLEKSNVIVEQVES